MKLKSLVDEDFANYKLPAMFLIFPQCTFKCDKEAGVNCCQNSTLAHAPDVETSPEEIVKRYINNPISKAIVCGGLEPMENFDDVLAILKQLRAKCTDDFVVYTGYTKGECAAIGWLDKLAAYPNVVIKFGRFVPNWTSRYDDVLGVTLASDNQYAERVS